MPNLRECKRIIESLLFVSEEPLTPVKCAQILEVDTATVTKILRNLQTEYQRDERGFQVRRVAGGFRLYSHPASAAWIEKLLLAWDGRRLTRAALETLAIIAYRQPLTKLDINSVRGVNSEGVVNSLLDKGLVKEVGRRQAPGRPIIYGTTNLFLERFGLNSLNDLPALNDFEPDETEREDIERRLYTESTALESKEREAAELPRRRGEENGASP